MTLAYSIYRKWFNTYRQTEQEEFWALSRVKNGDDVIFTQKDVVISLLTTYLYSNAYMYKLMFKCSYEFSIEKKV